jgi:hypothetical protein
MNSPVHEFEPTTQPPRLRQNVAAEVETITPAKARAMLEANTRNRKIRPRLVSSYARDIERGAWELTGESIKIATNGDLLDGQHRLLGVVEANTSARFLVVRGVAPESQRVMDSGARRQVHDQLDINGFSNTRVIAAAARLALTEPGAGFVAVGKDQPTHSEILEFIDCFSEELQQAGKAASHYSSLPIPPSVTVLAWMQFVQIDAAAAHSFFEDMKQQRLTGEGDPRLALVKRLQGAGWRGSQKQRIPQRQALSLVFRAWNAWRTGQSIRSLPTHTRGEEVAIPSRLH